MCLDLYAGGCDQILAAVVAVAAVAAGQPLTAVRQQGPAGYFSFPDEAELAQFSALGYRLFTGADAGGADSLVKAFS